MGSSIDIGCGIAFQSVGGIVRIRSIQSILFVRHLLAPGLPGGGIVRGGILAGGSGVRIGRIPTRRLSRERVGHWRFLLGSRRAAHLPGDEQADQRAQNCSSDGDRQPRGIAERRLRGWNDVSEASRARGILEDRCGQHECPPAEQGRKPQRHDDREGRMAADGAGR